MTSASLQIDKQFNKLQVNKLKDNDNLTNLNDNLTNLNDTMNVSIIINLITNFVSQIINNNKPNSSGLINVSNIVTDTSQTVYDKYIYNDNKQHLYSFIINKQKTKMKFLVVNNTELKNFENPLDDNSPYKEELEASIVLLDLIPNKYISNKFTWYNENSINISYTIAVTDNSGLVGPNGDEVYLVTGSGLNNPNSFM